MRKLAVNIILFFATLFSYSQVIKNDTLKLYYHDSIVVEKKFTDNKGKNSFEVKVINPCGLKDGPYDGAVSLISCKFKNKKYSDTINYNYPWAQSGLLYFNEKEIVLKDIQKTKAVFIPFFYCGNWDSINTVSYIIFYNNKKYLYHIEYYCNEDYNCKLNDDLKTKLKRMPINLKKIFIKMLQTKYKKASDLHAN